MSMALVQDNSFELPGRPQPVKADFGRYALLGYISIALVFGGFGVW